MRVNTVLFSRHNLFFFFSERKEERYSFLWLTQNQFIFLLKEEGEKNGHSLAQVSKLWASLWAKTNLKRVLIGIEHWQKSQ